MRAFILALSLLGACATANPPPASLANTSWALSQLPGAQPVAPPRRQTLTFSSDGHISGSGGCNGFGGDYTQSGAQLHFGHIIHTMMACTPGMDSEQAYMAALDNTRAAALAGDTLTLSNAQGQVVARLTRSQSEGS